MTLSFWRLSHLVLAIVSSLFLIVASLTGVVLAVDAMQERVAVERILNFEEITLQDCIPVLRQQYTEITSLSIDHNNNVTLEAIDNDGNEVNAYINSTTGKHIGTPEKKSNFIQWTTALHRSLFLHEAGRLSIGIASFFLILITVSGLLLIIKRQKGVLRFFSKVIKENFNQYYHIELGRITLVPLLIIAISGTYLSMERFNLFAEEHTSISSIERPVHREKFNFKNTLLSEVVNIEFPFSNDAEDYFIFELKDRKIEVQQYTFEIEKEKLFPVANTLTSLSLDIHTGRSSILWAFVLGMSSLSILFFIYSGFAMTLKRRSSRIKNSFKAIESNYILLIGSENGSSLRFANNILKQLISTGKKAHLTQLNDYQTYPKATHIIVLTSTYGLGDPPANANKFLSLLHKYPQSVGCYFTVVGFGSIKYPDFCAFAHQIDTAIQQQPWAKQLVPLQTVNDKSVIEFTNWVQLWNATTNDQLSTTPSLYNHVPKNLKTFKVISKTTISEKDQTFLLNLEANRTTKFTSGDLLAVYPKNDGTERLYSIANYNGQIQLAIKLHPNGIGSNFLFDANVGSVFKARIVDNHAFHFPKKAKKVALISNGTGIAPFVGMISQNNNKTETHLYCGFRQKTTLTDYYTSFASKMIQEAKLKEVRFAYSRETESQYVMDIIKKDAAFFADLLQNKGQIMICGAIKMQIDVEQLLDEICIEINNLPLEHYKLNGQIVTDCY